MEVRIGILNAPREVTIDMADDTSADELKAAVEAGVAESSVVWLTDKKVRDDRLVDLVPGEKVVYGADGDKGLRLNGFELEQCSADDAMVWDASTSSAAPAMLFADVNRIGELPVPMGIFRKVERPLFEADVHQQIDQVTEKKGPGELKDLIYAGDMWTVD